MTKKEVNFIIVLGMVTVIIIIVIDLKIKYFLTNYIVVIAQL